MMDRTCSFSYLGGRGRRIAWTQEAKAAMSQDRATAFQPGDRVRLSLKKKKVIFGQAQWLTSVIPAHFGKLRYVDQLRSEIRNQRGQNMAKPLQY